MKKILIALSLIFFFFHPAMAENKNIIILPLDARNQTYDYISRLVKICGYTPVMPPLESMGNINQYTDAYRKQYDIWFWLNNSMNRQCGVMILSADSFIYGGLLESRKSPITARDALKNADLLKKIKKRFPATNILVFSSIPRREAMDRRRNLSVNLRLLDLVKEGTISFLTISGDDMTDISSQVQEIAILKERIAQLHIEDRVFISDTDRIRLGIDESAMALFMKYLNDRRNKRPRIFIEYRDITSARTTIDRYSATSVMSIAIDMAEAVGAEVVYQPESADLILAVNHESPRRSMDDFLERTEKLIESKPVSIADVSGREEKFAFFRKICSKNIFPRLAGYATWGMGTNTMGTALCMGCAASLHCHDMQGFSEFLAFLYERMLADAIYINNIHLQLSQITGIPAYSLERMNGEEEEKATFITSELLMENIGNIGIKPEAEGDLIRFGISLPPGRLFGPEKNRPLSGFITAGPVSFPFHRLFEINIPTTFHFDQN